MGLFRLLKGQKVVDDFIVQFNERVLNWKGFFAQPWVNNFQRELLLCFIWGITEEFLICPVSFGVFVGKLYKEFVGLGLLGYLLCWMYGTLLWSILWLFRLIFADRMGLRILIGPFSLRMSSTFPLLIIFWQMFSNMWTLALLVFGYHYL